MPVIPSMKPKTNSAVEVLNAIKNSASINYQNYVPYATPDAESVKAIGAIIMDNVALQNEFISLINRIAAVYVTSRLYENPWAVFKKGELELGETIEEVFINLPVAHVFNPAGAVSTLPAREIPDVRAAYHVINYQEFYKQTIDRETLAHAFTSWGGVDDLIGRIVNAMSSAAAYDEFIIMKYMIALRCLDGTLKNYIISSMTPEDVVAAVKQTSNEFLFMGNTYNTAGVYTTCPREDQFVIETAEFDAVADVYVLAKAFNMDKVEFMGKRLLVDSFSFNAGEMARLAEIFNGDSSYTPFTSTELTLLGTIELLVCDKNLFMIFDKLNKMTEFYNGEGLYWNYFFHVWRIIGMSPFANAIFFESDGTGGVTAVTVSGGGAVPVGGSKQLTVTVTASGFCSRAVTWSSSDTTKVTVDARGIVTRLASGTVTITATSVDDSSITGTASIT